MIPEHCGGDGAHSFANHASEWGARPVHRSDENGRYAELQHRSGLAQLARAQISLKIPEPFGAGALFLPSLIVPVVLPKVIDEHDVAVYIFL